jgi:hypothetical protein
MAIIEFLLWFGILLVLIRMRAKWWVWVIFIIGTLIALIGKRRD